MKLGLFKDNELEELMSQSKLDPLKIQVLETKAVKLGISQDDGDEALDSDNGKAAIIKLIVDEAQAIKLKIDA